MFIQSETTPNPHAQKFLLDSDLGPVNPIFFHTIEEAVMKSSLAVKIFQIGNIQSVFFGKDFITITKVNNILWEIIKPEILMIIMDHLSAQIPILDKSMQQTASSDLDTKGMNDIEKQILEIIETRVRPSVAMDGGDIIYKGFCNGIVYLQLHGACAGCPSSTITLKNGIESMLKHFIPEVQSVEEMRQ